MRYNTNLTISQLKVMFHSKNQTNSFLFGDGRWLLWLLNFRIVTKIDFESNVRSFVVIFHFQFKSKGIGVLRPMFTYYIYERLASILSLPIFKPGRTGRTHKKNFIKIISFFEMKKKNTYLQKIHTHPLLCSWSTVSSRKIR